MTPITSLDLTGFTEREPGVWTDAAGLVLSVHFFPLTPDLPAPLHEQERLRAGLAQGVAGAGGGLIEAAFGVVDGVPAVRQLIKVPRPNGQGQVFLGSWTVPKAGCSTVLKVQAAEGAMTGMREAMVMAQVGPADYFRPHPYAGGGQLGGLPYHAGDDEQWDDRFPDHPLTQVRAALRRLTPTVTLDERFKTLPPFGTPEPQTPPPGERPQHTPPTPTTGPAPQTSPPPATDRAQQTSPPPAAPAPQAPPPPAPPAQQTPPPAAPADPRSSWMRPGPKG